MATGLGGGLSVLAALGLAEQTFWFTLISFACASICVGVQAGAVLSTLISQTPLATAITRVL